MRLAPVAIGALALLAACSGGVSRAQTPDSATGPADRGTVPPSLPDLPRAAPVSAVVAAPTTTRPSTTVPATTHPSTTATIEREPSAASEQRATAGQKEATGKPSGGKGEAAKKAGGKGEASKPSGGKGEAAKKAGGKGEAAKKAGGKGEAAKKAGGKGQAAKKAGAKQTGAAAATQPSPVVGALVAGLVAVEARVSAEGVASGRPLAVGDDGPDVQWVQRRLTELRFAPGNADGVLGKNTLAALWALQKAGGLEPRDVVDAESWTLLQQGVDVQPLVAADANRAEIDLDRQLMTIWRDGQLAMVTHVSTGSGEYYCGGGRCRNAVTPTGEYRVRRRIDGWRHGPLGSLYNPLYFNSGIAIHGSGFVPTWPDSHGCVRVPMNVAEDVPHLLDDDDAVHVLRSSELPTST